MAVSKDIHRGFSNSEWGSAGASMQRKALSAQLILLGVGASLHTSRFLRNLAKILEQKVLGLKDVPSAQAQ